MVDWDYLVLGPCMETFGGEHGRILYTPRDSVPFPIVGVFDRAYLELTPMGGGNGQEPGRLGAPGNVTERRPVLGVQLSQFLVQPRQHDTVLFQDLVPPLVYTVREVRPDSHGGALLLLNRVA